MACKCKVSGSSLCSSPTGINPFSFIHMQVLSSSASLCTFTFKENEETAFVTSSCLHHAYITSSVKHIPDTKSCIKQNYCGICFSLWDESEKLCMGLFVCMLLITGLYTRCHYNLIIHWK